MASSISAASTGGEKYERETQYFGFNPVSFVDDVINCVEDYACDGLDSFESALTPVVKEKKVQVGECVDKILADLSLYDPQALFCAHILLKKIRSCVYACSDH